MASLNRPSSPGPLLRFLIGLCFSAAIAVFPPTPAGEADTVERIGEGRWLQLDVGLIGVASEMILRSALQKTLDDGYSGLLIVLDTPGGSLESTRGMVQEIMVFQKPVVVWIGPSGAHAGSAGAFIALSAHVAAMAPGTNIGAATPVEGNGQDIGVGSDSEDMRRKVMNDTVSFMESIAQARGRNVEMAASFVSTALSVTATEAVENKVVDFVAADLEELFKHAAGRTVDLNGEKSVLAAADPVMVDSYDPSMREEILTILSNPNLFYLLFMIGLIGLGFELTHPGAMVPGVVGGICLILSLIAASVLPISFGSLALLLVGIGLMVGEAFLPSFGILGVGGLVAFILGSVFLVDPSGEQGLRISWLAIAPGSVGVAATVLSIGYLIVRSSLSVVKSGQEALVGALATVFTDFAGGKGKVMINGELWNAKATEALVKGQSVKVIGNDGLILIVRAESMVPAGISAS